MPNKWLTHVKQVRSQNAGMSFKNVLMLAKKSYKKQKGGSGVAKHAAKFDSSEKVEAEPEKQEGGKRKRRKRSRKRQRGGADEIGRAHV